MHQHKRSETQRSGTAPASPRTSSLDLGPLHHALPRAPLVSQQNRALISSTHQQQANGKQATRSLPFVQRTPKRLSTTEGLSVVSLPKRPASTAEGSRITSTPTRWQRPTLAESSKLFSNPGKGPGRPGNSQVVAGRKGSGGTKKLTEQDGIPSVARLPEDLLCHCFISVQSMYYLVNCAAVCRAWREVLLSDMVWKTMYLKWWQSAEVNEFLCGQTVRDTCVPSQDTRLPPKGYNSWRSAFIGRYQEGKKELIVKEKALAAREGYISIRPVADTHGKRAFDFVQGDGMQKLAERLGLSFNICLNRGRHNKIQGKGKTSIFQSSCIIRYPVSCIGNLDLLALKSVEDCDDLESLVAVESFKVTATSDRLLRACPFVDLTQLPMTSWEMVSMTSRSPGPLRLVQHRLSSEVSLIVGILSEETNHLDEINGKEQVLLIVLSVHLNNLLWKLMDLGEDPSSRVARRVVQNEVDPHYGLHHWYVSVQFHTFRRDIWHRTFKQVFWNPHESIPGEKAVFLLVSQNGFASEVFFPGVLMLPWKSEAFSGSLKGVYMLDVTLWDGGGEIAWESTSAVRIDPAPLAVVEYGIEFDGERVSTHVLDDERGVSMSINMCIPLNMTHWQATDERPMIAITDLQLGLTNKFLEGWCGLANI